jgi:predicted transcriptional regulator
MIFYLTSGQMSIIFNRNMTIKFENSDHHRQECFGNLAPEELEEFSAVCKALGHPVRVRLLQMFISQGDWVCGKLVHHFDLAQSTVSEHLRILLKANLIKREIYPGKGRKYCINMETIKKYKVLTARL